MTEKSPSVTVKNHYPSGGANVTVSVWLTEKERLDLIDRITSYETLLHNREKTIEALQLVEDATQSLQDGIESSEETVMDEFTWEVSIVE